MDPRDLIVQEEFDRQAERWFRRQLSPYERAMLEQIAQLAQVGPADRVLDVACGTGLVSFVLAPYAREVVGIDISPGMLAKAREIRHRREVRNVHFVLGEAEHMPFKDGEFDVVVCRLAIHHFPQPERELREMVRVLKPGGRLVISDTVSSEDEREARLHNALERLRDPSHARMLAPTELVHLIERIGVRVQERLLQRRDRTYDDWMDVINDPIRTENLKIVMEELARAGRGAGLRLRIEDGQLWLTHTIAVIKAIK
ncbi:MAG: methyltransferase domain-containing protein [Candidatus Bipolaricaulota bacterium]|nr:methyltransferase domain-containing protein [Candidatus Bipolaricaulota bacterium]MDW8030567.1 methyltransferase domain-containing protein [Candidatus Bipolaricaulota bacterium]